MNIMKLKKISTVGHIIFFRFLVIKSHCLKRNMTLSLIITLISMYHLKPLVSLGRFIKNLKTLHNVRAVHRGMFSTLGGYHEYSGGIP